MPSLTFAFFAFLGVAWAQTTFRPYDPCAMCEFVVNQAVSHYRKGDDKHHVEDELKHDCDSLKKFYGDQAVKDCHDWIHKNIDVIYDDIKNGKSTYQICYDMGECGGTAGTTRPPASTGTTTTTSTTTTTTTTTRTTTTTTTTTTTPVDLCAICVAVVDTARNRFNNKITDEVALNKELLADCQALSSAYDAMVVQNCINSVNQNIDIIFVDLVNGKTSSQVCTDMQQCK